MHKKTSIKKIIVIALLIAAVGGLGLVLLKGGSLISIGKSASASGQIVLVNDSSAKMSVEYKIDGKDVTKVLSPREEAVCGAKGFVRVFAADKSGSYEISYPSDQKNRRIMLSQIIKVAKKDSVDGEILTEKGIVGDIKVTYEEPLDLASTY